MKGISAIIALDMKRFFQEPMRLIPGLIQPLLYLFVLGSGLGASMGRLPASGTYRSFIFPGIISLALLYAATFAGITIVFDRQIGFFKAVLVAPVSRPAIAFGKVAAGAIQAFIQGIVLLFLTPLVGLHLGVIEIVLALLALVMASVVFSALGVALACRFTSTTVFPIVINTIIIPMYFLSGALYPLGPAPVWMQKVAHLDPMAYVVDLLRGALLGHDHMFFNPWTGIIFLSVLTGLLIWSSVRVFAKGEETDLTGASKFPWRR